MTPTNVTLLPICLNHENPLTFEQTGTLFGLPGMAHGTRRREFDLSVFLADTMVPLETPFSASGQIPAFESDNPDEIAYLIRDGEAPENTVQWRWLVNHALDALRSGGKVAVSCHDGHGRTGTLLACIWGLAHPQDANPVATLRHLICPRMVTSWAQVLFIHDFLGLPAPDPATRGAFFHYKALTDSNDDPLPTQYPIVHDPEELAADRDFRLLVDRDLTIHRDNLEVGPYVVDAYSIIPVVQIGGSWWIRFLCTTCYAALAVSDEDQFECTFCHDRSKRKTIGSPNGRV